MLTHHFNSESDEIALTFKVKEVFVSNLSFLIQLLDWFSNHAVKVIIAIIALIVITAIVIIIAPLSWVFAIFLFVQNRKIKKAIKEIPELSLGELQTIHNVLEKCAETITKLENSFDNKKAQTLPVIFKIFLFPLKCLYFPLTKVVGYNLKTIWELKKVADIQLEKDLTDFYSALETNTPISFGI